MSSQPMPSTHIWGATCDTCHGRFTPLKPTHKRCPECFRKHPLPRKIRGTGGFRTIVAKYDGTCAKCQGPFKAGDEIRYGGGMSKALCYHLGECPSNSQPMHNDEDRCFFCKQPVEECECE